MSTRARLALQERLTRDQRELRRAIYALAETASAKVDVRSRVLARPLLWLAAAFALGLRLGARR